MKTMIKLLKQLWRWLTHIKPTVDTELERITTSLEFKKLQRIIVRRAIGLRRKALRNENKRWSTTKSFNNG